MKNIIIIYFLFSVKIFAHGGMTEGPHGGKVKMPGNFHTELVIAENKLNIYLLDMKISNPLVADSSVEVTLGHLNETEKLSCLKEADYFSCPFKMPTAMIDSVKIMAKRAKNKGTAVYGAADIKPADKSAK